MRIPNLTGNITYIFSILDYERYAQEIRQEYIHIPEKEFKDRRAQVLY